MGNSNSAAKKSEKAKRRSISRAEILKKTATYVVPMDVLGKVMIVSTF